MGISARVSQRFTRASFLSTARGFFPPGFFEGLRGMMRPVGRAFVNRENTTDAQKLGQAGVSEVPSSDYLHHGQRWGL
jgi:hypothetical protein